MFALLTLLFVLALPAAALAQSAGDDQYSDPFGDTQGGGGDTSTDSGDTGSTGGNSGGGDAPVTSAPDTGSTAPDTGSAAPETTSVPVATESGGELPRTGFEIVLLLATAFPLLVAGVALRRVASEP